MLGLVKIGPTVLERTIFNVDNILNFLAIIPFGKGHGSSFHKFESSLPKNEANLRSASEGKEFVTLIKYFLAISLSSPNEERRDLLFEETRSPFIQGCLYLISPSVCKLFTFSTSSP